MGLAASTLPIVSGRAAKASLSSRGTFASIGSLPASHRLACICSISEHACDIRTGYAGPRTLTRGLRASYCGQPSDRLRHLAQLEFLDFSRRGFWDLGEDDVLRQL